MHESRRAPDRPRGSSRSRRYGARRARRHGRPWPSRPPSSKSRRPLPRLRSTPGKSEKPASRSRPRARSRGTSANAAPAVAKRSFARTVPCTDARGTPSSPPASSHPAMRGRNHPRQRQRGAQRVSVPEERGRIDPRPHFPKRARGGRQRSGVLRLGHRAEHGRGRGSRRGGSIGHRELDPARSQQLVGRRRDGEGAPIHGNARQVDRALEPFAGDAVFDLDRRQDGAEDRVIDMETHPRDRSAWRGRPGAGDRFPIRSSAARCSARVVAITRSGGSTSRSSSRIGRSDAGQGASGTRGPRGEEDERRPRDARRRIRRRLKGIARRWPAVRGRVGVALHEGVARRAARQRGPLPSRAPRHDSLPRPRGTHPSCVPWAKAKESWQRRAGH